jgi:hypothetical protein
MVSHVRLGIVGLLLTAAACSKPCERQGQQIICIARNYEYPRTYVDRDGDFLLDSVEQMSCRMGATIHEQDCTRVIEEFSAHALTCRSNDALDRAVSEYGYATRGAKAEQAYFSRLLQQSGLR